VSVKVKRRQRASFLRVKHIASTMRSRLRFGWAGEPVGSDYGMKTTLLADRAGFDSVWFGDHFFPWHHLPEAQVFFTWPVMAVAAERTKRVLIGTSVTTPIGGRYHPAVVAQAFATLDSMYPGRILLGVGTGEAINEAPFIGWPKWQERMDRLVEGLDLIRRLWSSDQYFTFEGNYFRMERAYLYIKPKTPVPIYFAASGEKSAYYAGRYGDHLLVLNTLSSADKCERMFLKFEEGAQGAGKDVSKMEKLIYLLGGIGDRVKLLHNMRKVDAGSWQSIDNPDPRDVMDRGQKLSDEVLASRYIVASGPDDIIEHFDRWTKIGGTHILFGDFSDDQTSTLEAFRTKIMPYFRESSSGS
jgi:coenzyme F420-dependent glucose-6-phosphate dehydrogenase